jgi:hypothetical protein
VESPLNYFELMVLIPESNRLLTVDDEIKRFIIRSHGVYTTTSQILDTIHACLLKNEAKHYWQSVEVAAQRYHS